MDVQLKAVCGKDVPPDTFVSLRIGDVNKQTRYVASRTHRFPEACAKEAFGRLEVFKRLGTANVAFDVNKDDGVVPCKIPGDPPEMSPSNWSFAAVRPASGANQSSHLPPVNSKGSSVALRLSAVQQYLAENNLGSELTNVVQDLFESKPADPATFLCDRMHLLKQPATSEIGAEMPAMPISNQQDVPGFDVIVEAAAEPAAVEDLFVSVKIGNMRRQMNYASRGALRFPESCAEQAEASVEVLRRIGTALVVFDFNSPGEPIPVKVPCEYPGLPGMFSWHVFVSGHGGKVPSQRTPNAQYLANHPVVTDMANMVEKLLTNKPQDPRNFLSSQAQALKNKPIYKPRPTTPKAMDPIERSQLSPAALQSCSSAPALGTWCEEEEARMRKVRQMVEEEARQAAIIADEARLPVKGGKKGQAVGVAKAALFTVSAEEFQASAREARPPAKVDMRGLALELPMPRTTDQVRSPSFINDQAISTEVLTKRRIGVLVQRGPDWKWRNKDGGPESVGMTLDSPAPDGWVRVLWRCGTDQSFRIGDNGKFDLCVLMEPQGRTDQRQMIKEAANASMVDMPLSEAQTDEACWEYMDVQGCKRGPFCTQKMVQWYEHGLLADDLPVRHIKSPSYVPFVTFKQKFPQAKPPPKTESDAVDPTCSRESKASQCDCRWIYVDCKGNPQGPFRSDQLKAWWESKMLPEQLNLRRETDPQDKFAFLDDFFPSPHRAFQSPPTTPREMHPPVASAASPLSTEEANAAEARRKSRQEALAKLTNQNAAASAFNNAAQARRTSRLVALENLRKAKGADGIGERIRVNIVRATGLLDANCWGFCDPFCMLEVHGNNGLLCRKFKTRIIGNDTNPVWDQTCEFDYEIGGHINFTVWGKEFGMSDICLGKLSLSQEQFGHRGFIGYGVLQETGRKAVEEESRIWLKIEVIPSAGSAAGA